MTSVSNPREFFDLVKAIGESKSKQEEDRIITEEVIYLKKAIPQQGVAKKKMKEMIVRSLYVEMLGQDASFAYIKAVELCASTNIAQKKVGFLAASLCLSPDHEFRFMLVNQIQRDMKSANILEVGVALSAVCKIVTEDMIPAVMNDVVKLLKHDNESVRKKAICAMQRFYQMDKRCMMDHTDKVRRALCDKDPSVMGACLPLFHAMIQDDALLFKDLVPSFVSILKQITEHRLPRDFDYHRIPAPWIQMSLLRILGLLGRGDQASSEGMYEVLVDVMKRADTGINEGNAIDYEAVKTDTTIYPNTLLLDAAATAISRFIRSDSHNLKYIGIKGLASIVKDHPRYAADHQMAVIDCLEDPDETLKRKTLDLLFRMTNAVNVEFIVQKLLLFLGSTSDDHFRTDLVGQITQCAERFAPSNAWYVQTVIKVFELAGEKVKPSVAQTLTQLIAEGNADDEEDEEEEEEGEEGTRDDRLRRDTVEHFLILITKPNQPEVLSQAVAWVLGEYGYLAKSCSVEAIMDKLCDLSHTSHSAATKGHIITSLMKLVAQNGSCPQRVLALVNLFSQSLSLDVQQRCIEFQGLLLNSGTMVDVLPVDASCEDIEVDEDMSFLDAFVTQALHAGASAYNPPRHVDGEYDEEDGVKAKAAGLKMTPYEMPTMPHAPAASSGMLAGTGGAMGSGGGAEGGAAHTPAPAASSSSSGLNSSPQQPVSAAAQQGNQLINTRGVTAVWGRKMEPPPPPPAPVVPASPPATANFSATAAMAAITGGNINNNPAAVSSPSVAPTPTGPPPPRELTEKEKMAAALFGGVGGTTKPAGAKKRASAHHTSSANSTTSSPPGSVNTAPAAPSLLDHHSLSSPPPPVPSSGGSGTAMTQSDEDAAAAALLMGMDISSTPVHHHQAPPATSPAPALSSASMELLDMVMPPLPPAAPVATSMGGGGGSSSSSANALSNAFADMDVMSLSPMSTTNGAIGGGASSTGGIVGIGGGMGGMSSSLSAINQLGIQPLKTTTAEFGRRWGITPCESKRSTTPGSCPMIASLPQLRQAMEKVGNYFHVESIDSTNEAIFAATVTSHGSVCLVHVKLYPTGPRRGAIDITVKAQTGEIAGSESNRIQGVLMNFGK